MKDRVAIVTGAASGIGRAAARRLAQHGARVLLVDIDPAVAEEARALEGANGAAGATTPRVARRAGAARALEGGTGVVGFVVADISVATDCEAVVSAALRLHGGVDALVNGAGVMHRGTVLEIAETDWERSMAVNVRSVYLLSRAVLPELRRRGGGAIVNIASGWGLAAGPRAVAYCAAKGAVVQMTRAMAIDHAAEGIRVNCVCPGDIDTPMLRREARQLGEDPDAFLARAAARPAGRVGDAAEVAETILFLLDDRARYITGEALVVDGGGLIG